MKPTISLLTLVLLAGPAAAQDRPQIRSLLLEEAYRPESAPRQGDAAWDWLKRGVYQAKEARVMLGDAKEWSTGAERPPEEWAELDRRLGEVEAAHRALLEPGVRALYMAMLRSRNVVTGVDHVLAEREFYPEVGRPGGPSSAMGFSPDAESVQGLRVLREDAHGYSVQAEEQLEKALERLRKEPRKSSQIPDYIADLIEEARGSLARGASMALGIARAQAELMGPKGAYARTIDAVEAFGGPDGKGSYEESLRAKAVASTNESKRLFVAQEYALTSRIEENRTLAYLLERFGKL